MGTGENSSACGPQVQPSCGRRHYAALLVVCYPPICAHWGTWRYTEKLLGREERGAVIHQLYSSQTICVVLIHREWVKWGAVQLDTQVTNVFCSLLSSFLSLGTSTDSFSTAVVVNGLWKGCFPYWTNRVVPNFPRLCVLLVWFRRDMLVTEVSSLFFYPQI